jgi:hypothetical protein
MKLADDAGLHPGFRQGTDPVTDLERAGLDIVWLAEAHGFDSPTGGLPGRGRDRRQRAIVDGGWLGHCAVL